MTEDIKFTLGTDEFLVIDITDRLGAIHDLTGMNVLFDLRKKNSAQWELQGQPTVVNLMRVSCLIDTRGWSETKIGTYQVYLSFDIAPEHPRLGPFEFRVDR